MKTCTCMRCGHTYMATRIRPFCSNTCRTAFMAANPTPAILIGALNASSNTPQHH